ncbi:MAG TPA: sporulation/spore germination protein [Allocoleopsis sp.]
MNCLKKYFAPLLVGALVVTLSSCNSSPTGPTSDSAGVPPAATPSSPSTALSDSATPTPASPVEETPVVTPSTPLNQNIPISTPSASSISTQKTPTQKTPTAKQSSNTTSTKAASTAQSDKTVTLKIYRADSQCQNLVPETAAVPSANPVNSAIGKVIEEANSSDFELAGYRVDVNKNGVATVDLRRSPNSQRQFASLSACEQFALFGSLRKTLTANSQLKIKDVRFTEQGKQISL